MSTAVINPADLHGVVNACTQDCIIVITRLAQRLPEDARRELSLNLCHYCSAKAIGADHSFHIPLNGDRQVPSAATEAADKIECLADKWALTNTVGMRPLYSRIIAALACHPLFVAI